MERINSSFRDPSGYLFKRDGKIFRYIDDRYCDTFLYFSNGGLYDELIDKGLMIKHKVVSDHIIEPEMIDVISYPYEWCFGQLKDAALLTIEVEKIALKHNMTLKDASSYNIQFVDGKPIFIDTLSFECFYNTPWKAYGQFVRHFFVSLALMAYKDVRLGNMLRNFMDGIPIDLADSLLPWKLNLLVHIKLNSFLYRKYEKKSIDTRQFKMSKGSLLSFLNDLENSVKSIKLNRKKTYWQDYYDFTNYSKEAFLDKERIVSEYLQIVKPKTLIDFGCNTGEFSVLASSLSDKVISIDNDYGSIERLYSKKVNNVLPLVVDLTNPSPNLGFAEIERDSISKRLKADCVMVLALIHHLRISNNTPLSNIVDYLKLFSKSLIVEFVPKSDSQIIRMLRNREDIFYDYTQDNFEMILKETYTIIRRDRIIGSERILYLMERI